MTSPAKKKNKTDGGNEKWLIYGATGWLGSKLLKMLKDENADVHVGKARLDNFDDVKKELDSLSPTHILNAAGITGRPNVDWCEANQQATIRTNVLGTLSLADLAEQRNIHVALLATGCIYEYDGQDHKLGNGVGFTEEDPANFIGSFYSLTKGMVDKMLDSYSNVLTLRFRMPISSEYEHPRNFITKITHYRRVVDVPNSMTVVDDMLPLVLILSKKKKTGKYNFTNPGTISHNEVLHLYKEHVHNDFEWENFTVEEQAKILAAGRSNNELDVSKLVKEFPDLLDIKSAVKKACIEMGKSKPEGAKCPQKLK